MREIKFRAWNKENKKMYGCYGFDVLNEKIYRCNLANSEFRDGHLETIYAVEDDLNSFELMQYTGLKDKNGTEIYEGDIVHFKTDGMSGKGYVYWNDEIAQFWIKDIREVTKRRGQRFYPFWKNCVYRIDGNIYENPELLEVEK